MPDRRDAATAFREARLIAEIEDGKIRTTLYGDPSNTELIRDFGPLPNFEDIAANLLGPLRLGRLPSPQTFRDCGRQLGQAILPRRVREVLVSLVRTGPVRLTVESGNPQLDGMPWELADPDADHFGPLCLAHRIFLVRGGHREGKSYPVSDNSGRVLTVLADPRSAAYPGLAHAEGEVRSIERALESPECRSFEVRPLRNATPASLSRTLKEFPPDVLHFVGHGALRPSGGALVLESGEIGRESIIYGSELAVLLREAGTRLVILSSCLTSSAGSISQDLVREGVPAVVGMQTQIRDTSAKQFARALYASLAEGATLEESVQEARTAILGVEAEWASPVLTISGQFPTFAGKSKADTEPLIHHNLPFEERPFIGRVAERSNLLRLFASERARLVTITGMGGMGKTRLSKQVAVDLLDSFRDGVWLLECEAMTSRDEIVSAVAAALQVPHVPPSEPNLLKSLNSLEALLIFDCFERLVGYADFLSSILRSTSRIQILVTSRTLLGVASEREVVLEPMIQYAKRGSTPDAVRLFVETASTMMPGWRMSRSQRKLVDELIGDLEAVPLAILLAAGRLRHMSLEQLCDRVKNHRLETLRRRPLGPLDRHADLLRVVGDSFALLFDDEKRLAERLSVFRGGFFAEDAQAVLDSELDVFGGIGTLRDHSLLMSQIVSGRMRFKFLDTIIEYIERVTPSAELDDVRVRHAHRFVARASAIREKLRAGLWREANPELWVDLANYRAASRFATKSGDTRLVCQAAHALARPYFEAGLRDEFEELATAAESAARIENDLVLLVELRGLQGALRRREQRTEAALEFWRERAELCKEIGDTENESESLLDMADLHVAIENFEECSSVLERFDALGPLQAKTIASRLLIEARMRLRQGDREAAIARATEAESIAKSIESSRQSLYVWLSLSYLFRAAGSYDRSEQISRRLIVEALDRGYPQSVGKALLELATTLEECGRIEEAAEALATASQIPRDVSSALREECRARRQKFSHEYDPAILEGALEVARAGGWSVLARKLGIQTARPT